MAYFWGRWCAAYSYFHTLLLSKKYCRHWHSRASATVGWPISVSSMAECSWPSVPAHSESMGNVAESQCERLLHPTYWSSTATSHQRLHHWEWSDRVLPETQHQTASWQAKADSLKSFKLWMVQLWVQPAEKISTGFWLWVSKLSLLPAACWVRQIKEPGLVSLACNYIGVNVQPCLITSWSIKVKLISLQLVQAAVSIQMQHLLQVCAYWWCLYIYNEFSVLMSPCQPVLC